MRERIQEWITSELPDIVQARKQYVLSLALLGLMGLNTLFLVGTTILWLLNQTGTIGPIFSSALLLIYHLAFELNRKGKTKVAACITVISLFLVMASAHFTIGLGHSPLVGYAMTVVLAGLFLGVKPALLFALLGTGIRTAVAIAQATGQLPHPIPPESWIIADAIAIGSGLAVLVVLNELTSRQIKQALQRERSLTQELQARHDQLEKRVTEREQLLAALKESEERLALAVTGANLGSWDWNIETGEVIFNGHWANMLGYSLEELEPNISTWRALVHPDDHPYVMDAINIHSEEQSDFYEAEYRLKTKSGGWKWILDRGRIFERHADGRPLRMVGIHLDVTERKQAEQELKRTQWEKERILDSQLEHVIYQDTENRILWPNLAACTSVDKTREELIGKFCYNVWAERASQCEDCPVSRAIRTGKTQEIEKATPDGRVWFIRGYPVQDMDGKIVGGIEVTQEITERVRTEKEIHKLNAELEQRVAERTAELQAVNKELEAFAYSISHDLRAPLRAIDGFSQAAIEDCADSISEMGKDYLARVQKASQRMQQLINDLLKLSRLTRGVMRRDSVDLSRLAREVVETYQTEQTEKHIDITIAPGMTCYGDARLLRVALGNLVNNAMKFTSKKPRTKIEIGMTQMNDRQAYFIKDNGAGFNMAYADRLFQAFQRLHTEDEFKGTGIGLATVQRIIHRHGGRIWAEAEIDKGATFYFTLNSKEGYSQK